MKRFKAPKIWVVVDTKPFEILGFERSKRRADAECAVYNRLVGYEPTCRVVEYTPTLPITDGDPR